MVEERYAALDRTRHAHLVLFHEQLDEVRLLVGIKHARKIGARAGVPARMEIFIRIGLWLFPEEQLLLSSGEGTVEIIQEERIQIFSAADKCVLELAAQRGRCR